MRAENRNPLAVYLTENHKHTVRLDFVVLARFHHNCRQGDFSSPRDHLTSAWESEICPQQNTRSRIGLLYHSLIVYAARSIRALRAIGPH